MAWRVFGEERLINYRSAVGQAVVRPGFRNQTGCTWLGVVKREIGVFASIVR